MSQELIEVELDGRLDATARCGGRVCGDFSAGAPALVRAALPGERLVARVDHRSRRGVAFATVTEILRPVKDRVPSPCAHFPICGGCDLLHAALPFQHDFKRARVAAALGLEVERVDPVLASPDAEGYRTFVKLVVHAGRMLGSYRPYSHEVVDMKGCCIHAVAAERIADRVRAELDREPDRERALRYVLIRTSLDEDRSLVCLVVRSRRCEIANRLLSVLSAEPDVAQVMLHENAETSDAIFGPGPKISLLHRGSPKERIGPIVQTLSVDGFSQVNPRAAAVLYQRVAELTEPKGKRILDLYSGSGGISFTLAAAGAALVVGVDSNSAAVSAAEEARAHNDPAFSVRFVARPAEAALEELPDPGAIIVNPPRKGCSPELLEAIAKTPPELMVYVSCNPDSLARDLAVLAKGGLTLLRACPVDLFPHTSHIETVVALRRTGA